MRILIASGLGSADIGGPAQYGAHLRDEFEKLGHEVRLRQYGSIESTLFKVWPSAFWADKILTLDTFSVGLPSVLAAGIFRKKVLVRIGGDFLWSAYVNRTGAAITLPEFYNSMPRLNMKEQLIFTLTKWFVSSVDHLSFNTEWQKSIWQKFYKFRDDKSNVVRNYIPKMNVGELSEQMIFLWAGRAIPEKNLGMLKKVGRKIMEKHPEVKVEIVTGASHEKILEKAKQCYAALSPAFTDICPNFIIEAISNGKPFIMTRETGLDEIYPKGGIFIDPKDEQALESAIERMLDVKFYNESVEELKGSGARNSWEDIAKSYISIWNKAN